jgi:transposase
MDVDQTCPSTVIATEPYSLIGTARLNGIEPYSWLERTLEKLPSYPVNRVHELLPLAR